METFAVIIVVLDFLWLAIYNLCHLNFVARTSYRIANISQFFQIRLKNNFADKIFVVYLPVEPCICYELEILQEKFFAVVL